MHLDEECEEIPESFGWASINVGGFECGTPTQDSAVMVEGVLENCFRLTNGRILFENSKNPIHIRHSKFRKIIMTTL